MFLSRRQWLAQAANGFGAVALTALLNQTARSDSKGATPLSFPQRAKSIIFLYMDGGPSQVDTFDPKPMLTEHHGKNPADLFEVAPTQFNNNGVVLGSPWKFEKHGESGIPVSSLFPNVAKHVDKLAVVRSMTSQFPEHTFANYFLHTGSGLQGRPSMGAWTTYGLGSENANLPGFVVLNGGLIPPGGLDCFGNGFLPATFQGSVLRPTGQSIANVTPLERDPAQQRRKLDLIRKLDQFTVQEYGKHDAIESAIYNYELAYRMQMEVPELCDISDETAETQKQYGLDASYEQTRIFGRECLLARRLVEKGVRFIELTCPNVGHDRWDQHSNLKQGHEDNARAVDQPIAALLDDLQKRGLLDTTLVVWAGEFGRTPFAQGADGRDHNPFGFTIWMAGGGIKGGTTYGETDEWGYRAVSNKLEIHDLHATMLYLLGIDHTKSTVRFGGRDMRLTDVHGHVIHDIIA
ncbi:MAG: DUF1501 domain-containing protein [Pirellula sp.]|jgi:hypothetical protein|nr:DUF1501 domain-containing protein [Pirellula sp.]